MDEFMISIIMSVYNGEKYVSYAIESILCQTFREFEFLIVNDGSTDSTPEILEKYAKRDSRIKIFHQENKGLIKSLNSLISVAKGIFIARQDADDISAVTRLQKQVKFLKKSNRIDALGTSHFLIDDKNKIIDLFLRPSTHEQIKALLPYINPMCHGSMVIRKEIFNELGGYNESALYVEDYEMWLRMVTKNKKISNLREPLYFWRVHKEGIASSKIKEQKKKFIEIKKIFFPNITSENLLSKGQTISHNYPGFFLYDLFWKLKGLVNVIQCKKNGIPVKIL